MSAETSIGLEGVLPLVVFPVVRQLLPQDKPQIQVRSVLEGESGAVRVPAPSSPSCAAASLSPCHAADQSVPLPGAQKPCNWYGGNEVMEVSGSENVH